MTVPAIAPLPDLPGAIRAYLRSIPAITDLVDDRVWIGWPRDPDGTLRVKVPPFSYAVLVEPGRGGIGADPEVPYQTERVDLSCLGPDPSSAHRLWRTVAAYLADPERRLPSTFRAANTLVSRVVQESSPFRQLEPGTNWPRTWCSYQFTYCAIPLSEMGS